MTTRTYGAKYSQLDPYASAAEIARAVRADIKAAVEAGELGTHPGEIKFAVRSSSYSMGCSVNVYIRNAPESWLWSEEPDPNYADNRKIVSTAARELADKLRPILNAYNHDGSDTMTDYYDVRYHGQVMAEGGLLL